MPKKKTTDASLTTPAPRARAVRTTTNRRTTTAPRNGNGNGASPPNPTHSEIAEAAYHRFLRRGGAPGNAFDDWVEAERELRQRVVD